MIQTTIKDALAGNGANETILIRGWVRTRRDSKDFSFLAINDGSCLANIQAIVDQGIPGSDDIQQATTGASVEITGKLIADELVKRHIAIKGTNDPVAVRAEVSRSICVQSVRVGQSHQICPVARHVLAVLRTIEERVDAFFIIACGGVVVEGSQFLKCRWQAGEVQS